MFAFGAPATTQAQTAAPVGGFQFGAPAASSTAATAPATGLPFGTGGAAPSFGAPTLASTSQPQTSAPGGGFQFGAPAASSTPAPAPGLTFGTGGALPSFGAPTAATTGQAPATAAAPAGGFQFGAPVAAPAASTTAPATGFGLGTSGTLPTFGTPAATTTTQVTTGQPVLSLGLPSSTATTASVAPTLTLGTAPATTLPGTLGTGTLPAFGIPTTTQTTTAADASATAGQPQQASFTTLAGGLGGTPSTAFVDNTFSAATTGAGGPASLQNASAPKPGASRDPTLPPELAVLVDELKDNIRKDRAALLKVESTKNPVEQVAKRLEDIRQSVANVCNINSRVIINLKFMQTTIEQDIRDAETALLMREVPLNLQHNYQFPMEYFFRKVKEFEEKLALFEREIEKAEARFSSERREPTSAMDLYRALKVSRDCTVVLAAKIKDLHERCLKQVQIHKNIRYFVHGDLAPDIFAEKLRIPPRSSAPPRQNLQFPNLIPSVSEDPTKLYLSYLASSKVMPSGAPFHSTLNYPSYAQPNKPYDSMSFNPSGSGSPNPYYHSQMSSPGQHTSLNLTAPGQISPGLSLKRTKH